jgi:hypothetical protein
MKPLNWIAWISSGIGLILVILGIISILFGRLRPQTESVSFFHAANSFFLMTIALFVYLIKCQGKKE